MQATGIWPAPVRLHAGSIYLNLVEPASGFPPTKFLGALSKKPTLNVRIWIQFWKLSNQINWFSLAFGRTAEHRGALKSATPEAERATASCLPQAHTLANPSNCSRNEFAASKLNLIVSFADWITVSIVINYRNRRLDRNSIANFSPQNGFSIRTTHKAHLSLVSLPSAWKSMHVFPKNWIKIPGQRTGVFLKRFFFVLILWFSSHLVKLNRNWM